MQKHARKRAALAQKKDIPALITPATSSFHVDTRDGAVQVDVRDSLAAPRYCGVRISGVTVKPSPAVFQDRLKAIGLKPINNIVDKRVQEALASNKRSATNTPNKHTTENSGLTKGGSTKDLQKGASSKGGNTTGNTKPLG